LSPVIRAEGLGKCYRRRRTPAGACEPHWALRDVSFQIARGELVAVVGSNGAGKSVLLRILSRITDPTCGRAWVRGRAGSLLEVGTGFHPELSGRENVFLSGAILGMTRREIERRFDEIVDFAGTADALEAPVKHYSSGMTVRLAFSVAAHLSADILFLDEVWATGDAEFRDRCALKMRQLVSTGRTALIVSHDLSQLRGLCRRALWLERGELMLDGPMEEVARRYTVDAASRVEAFRLGPA
jgi:lipopolysaccharide transport system ATP-binding protein